MTQDRLFTLSTYLQPSEGEPIRSVISRTDDAAVIAWHVKLG